MFYHGLLIPDNKRCADRVPFPAIPGYLYAEVEYRIKDVLLDVSAGKDLVFPGIRTDPAGCSCPVFGNIFSQEEHAARPFAAIQQGQYFPGNPEFLSGLSLILKSMDGVSVTAENRIIDHGNHLLCIP